jgi:hypothetical protein
LATVALAGVAMTGAAGPAHSASARSSHKFAGTPTVGALFMPNAYPLLHTCTASVIRSRSRNVIMTAAHCMDGKGPGYVFAPGYVDGRTPYGVWHVTAAYGSTSWLHQGKRSTRHDWAFLRVANKTVGGKVVHLQDVVGGNRLGTTVKAKTEVAVPGYPFGSGGKPITCRAPVYLHDGYPAFNCGGYVGGTSGSPWLIGHGKVRTVVGLISGLHQGGCTPGTSYSSPLGTAARSALTRAEHRRHADTFPSPPGDGC